MIDLPSDDAKANGIARIGAQPIALAAVALVVMLVGAGSIALWRASTGTTPESDRVVATRQIQARTAQASEQLVEKTKGLEVSQQESIDQLQVLQDQMQTVKRLLAAEQGEAKRLTDQVSTLATAVDSLRQSFASSQATETPNAPAARRATRPKFRASKGARRAKSPT
jgi:uncharacterized protein HemX